MEASHVIGCKLVLRTKSYQLRGLTVLLIIKKKKNKQMSNSSVACTKYLRSDLAFLGK